MRALFILIDVKDGYSGQVAATRMVAKAYALAGVDIEYYGLPFLDRSRKRPGLRSLVQLACRLLSRYGKLLFQGRGNWDVVHLSLGQTRFALIRDGIAFQLARFRTGAASCRLVALNGNLFSQWRVDSLNARLLRWIVRRSDRITCVGPRQQAKLIELGIPPHKITVIPNACEESPITVAECRSKQSNAEKLNILFLSTLYETKGYPEFLEALALISRHGSAPRIHGVLCGPVTVSAFDQQFTSNQQAETWIQNKIGQIGESGSVTARWVPGARGEAKHALFREAHIFVLPTRYPVEAQPLALLEAMANGCACITTAIAEIPSMLDESSAIFVPSQSPESIADAIVRLANDEALRTELAENALARFQESFTLEHYRSRWLELLDA